MNALVFSIGFLFTLFSMLMFVAWRQSVAIKKALEELEG